MKKLTELSEKELGYKDAKDFLESALKDDTIVTGNITESMRGGFFNGSINLNPLTSELSRYVSARLAYSNFHDRLTE